MICSVYISSHMPGCFNNCVVSAVIQQYIFLPINIKCYISMSAEMPHEHVFLLHQRALFNYTVSPTIKIEKLFSTEKKGGSVKK